MKYLSLFSGIGGFELGIQQAYESNHEHAHIGEESGQEERPQGRKRSAHIDRTLLHDRDGSAPLCVGYSEIDKYAIQIYEKHFPEHKNFGDITKIKETELPAFDFLCGGFPCQSFSIAGKRGGFNDTRGTMFFHIARILKAKQPKLLLLENVKGLLSHDEGRTFATIISTLDELGYDLQWQVLNSKNFGVPQNRERVFIVGHLRGTHRPEVFPFGDDGKKTDELSEHVSNTLTRRYEGAQAVGTYIGEGELDAQEIESSRQSVLQKWNQSDNSDSGRGKTYPSNIRRLTPKECERLQGFPHDWTTIGTTFVNNEIGEPVDIGIMSKISDTQRYKCLGNAVTVNVIQAIMEKLI